MLRNFRILLSTAAVLLSAGAVASAQTNRDWEKYSPYYEDDAWYDVTEWFDGNDYNSSNEDAADVDGDFRTSADASTSSGFDDDPSYDYGYDDRFDTDNWYYDYHDPGYYSYLDFNNDDTYDVYSRFYDFDGDGLYDAYYSYADRDEDGIYEDVSYLTFNDAGQQNGSSDKGANRNDRSKSAEETPRKQTVSGTVEKSKTVAVRDTKHRVVEIMKDDDKKCLIDLGPVNALPDLQLEQGDKLSAQGPMANVGDRQIVLAEEFTRNGKTHEVDRSAQSRTGTIVDLRRAKLRGVEHQMAVLQIDDKKRLVDLGPAKDLSRLNIKKNQDVSVHGPMAKVDDRIVIVAHRVSQGDKTVDVQRSGSTENQGTRKSRKQARERQAEAS